MQAGNLLALLVAYADHTFLQGPPADIVTFRCLVDLAQRVGLHFSESVPRHAAYSSDPAIAAALAEELGIRHARDGLLAAGTPVGAATLHCCHTSLLPDNVGTRHWTCSRLIGLNVLSKTTGSPSQDPLHMAHLPRVSE
jgi:hypothetical protein